MWLKGKYHYLLVTSYLLSFSMLHTATQFYLKLLWEWKWFLFCFLIYTLLSDILILFSVNFRQMCAFPKDKYFIIFCSEDSHCCIYIFNYFLCPVDFWRVPRLYLLGNWCFLVKLLENIVFLCIWTAEIPLISSSLSFFALSNTLRCNIKHTWNILTLYVRETFLWRCSLID